MNQPIKENEFNRNAARPQLDKEARRAIELFLSHLTEAKLDNISRVLIYGSRIHDKHRPDSDIDIAVVFRQKSPDKPIRYKLQKHLALIDTRTMTESTIPVSSIALWEDWLDYPDQQKNPAFFHRLNTQHININDLI